MYMVILQCNKQPDNIVNNCLFQERLVVVASLSDFLSDHKMRFYCTKKTLEKCHVMSSNIQRMFVSFFSKIIDSIKYTSFSVFTQMGVNIYERNYICQTFMTIFKLFKGCSEVSISTHQILTSSRIIEQFLVHFIDICK